MSSRSISPALSHSSRGLYVPVHKRNNGSMSSSSSRASSSSASSSESDAITPPAQPAFIYSRDTLLNLAKSPLSRLPIEVREKLRVEVPDLITNRKQRKAIEYHKQLVDNAALAPRRQRPSARPIDRKRIAPQVVDRVWRHAQSIAPPTITPIALVA